MQKSGNFCRESTVICRLVIKGSSHFLCCRCCLQMIGYETITLRYIKSRQQPALITPFVLYSCFKQQFLLPRVALPGNMGESQHVRSCKMREPSGFSCSFKRRCGSLWIYKEIVSVFLSFGCFAQLITGSLGHQEGGALPVKYNVFFFVFNNNLIFPSLDIKCFHLLPNSLSFSCLTEKHLCMTLYGWR